MGGWPGLIDRARGSPRFAATTAVAAGGITMDVPLSLGIFPQPTLARHFPASEPGPNERNCSRNGSGFRANRKIPKLTTFPLWER